MDRDDSHSALVQRKQSGTRRDSSDYDQSDDEAHPQVFTPVSRSLTNETFWTSTCQSSRTNLESAQQSDNTDQIYIALEEIESKASHLARSFANLEQCTGKFDEGWLSDRIIFMRRVWLNEVKRNAEEVARSQLRNKQRRRTLRASQCENATMMQPCLEGGMKEGAEVEEVQTSPSKGFVKKWRSKLPIIGGSTA